MQSKYHHLIPQTYLSAWANPSGTLKIERNSTKKIEFRNTKSVAGINHYHSIIAGMSLCNKNDTDTFFYILKDYNVSYNGMNLRNTLEMNKYYHMFNEWSITRADGSIVNKRSLKNKIDQIKIQDIENLWAEKYENKWSAVRKIIEEKVLTNKSSVPRFYFEYLTRFYVVLDWRSFTSNEEFSSAFEEISSNQLCLNKIEIPKDERELPMFETVSDYTKHCLLLRYYRQFLNDNGIIYEHAKQLMRKITFRFLVTEGNTKFITSDNPSFMNNNSNGTKTGMLPISPNILMIIGKDSSNKDKYYITKISDLEVQKCNEIIKKHSGQFVVIDNT